jgi:hypothetical protein
MKICNKCKSEKDDIGFRPKRQTCLVCESVYSTEYERAHREARRLKAASYRSKKKPGETEWRKTGNPLKYRIQLYRGGARKRGIEWKLSDVEAAWLMMEPCFYCGATQSPTGGIDRMNPAKPYDWQNVVPSCSRCNLSKQSMTAEQFVVASAEISSTFGKEW